jgi:hypothetical protein
MKLQSLLKNGKNEIKINESHPYRVLSESVEGFVGYMGKSLCNRMKTRLYFGSGWEKIEIAL